MPLRISGKTVDIGESLRGHMNERTKTIITKYFGGTYTGHVTLEREGSGFRTECVVHLSSGMDLQTEGVANDPYACFDQAADKLEKRLGRYKKRLKAHAAQGQKQFMTAASYILAAPSADQDVADNDSAQHPEGEDSHAPMIIAEMTARVRTLTVSAAVHELDLSGAPTMVFKNAGNGRLNVVYKRTDGNVGWIDPPAE